MVYKIWYEFVARQYVLWVLNQMWIRLYGKIIGEIWFKLIERCEKNPKLDWSYPKCIHTCWQILNIRTLACPYYEKTPEPLILKLLNEETHTIFFDQICIQVALMI